MGNVTDLPHIGINRLGNVRKQRKAFQTKIKHNLRKELNEVEISNLHNKDFKGMIIKTLTKLGKRMNIVRNLTELEKYEEEPSRSKNIVSEIKNA